MTIALAITLGFASIVAFCAAANLLSEVVLMMRLQLTRSSDDLSAKDYFPPMLMSIMGFIISSGLAYVVVRLVL